MKTSPFDEPDAMSRKDVTLAIYYLTKHRWLGFALLLFPDGRLAYRVAEIFGEGLDVSEILSMEHRTTIEFLRGLLCFLSEPDFTMLWWDTTVRRCWDVEPTQH